MVVVKEKKQNDENIDIIASFNNNYLLISNNL
jgi:hypothetical protein